MSFIPKMQDAKGRTLKIINEDIATEINFIVWRLRETLAPALEKIEAECFIEDEHCIHAVGRASDDAPRLLDLRFGEAHHPKVTLVGKGVCFDSGGLDIKPASGMLLIRKDMGRKILAFVACMRATH